MDEVFAVNGRQPFQDTFDNMASLLEFNKPLLFWALIGVDVSFVTKLHNDEDPALI